MNVNLEVKKRVLCVDDDAINRLVLKHMLVALNMEVDLASEGTSALALVKKQAYDLILLDILMPEIDGFKTAAAIRKICSSPIPIVFISAGIFDDLQAQMEALNISHFLPKPIEKEVLQKIIEQLF